MAVIHFNESDALQTKVIEAAVYPCEVVKIDGPKKSGSGKSVNTFMDIMITDGPAKNKTITVAFSSGTNSAGPLGKMMWFPQASMLELHSAITGRQVVPEKFSLDTDELLHKPFDCQWGVATDEGILFNTILAFHPKGYGASAPSF